MSTDHKISNFFNSYLDNEKDDQGSDLFSDIDWDHPEPEDKNSLEYAKYVAHLLLRNGVDVEISPRDKKKIMEYIFNKPKQEDADA